MLSVERLNAITELARKTGAVKTEDLIKRFNVSSETIRRDLLALEKQGALHRVYGGAVTGGETVAIKRLDERMDDFRKQKQELCRLAISLINEGDVIAIDEGSTAFEFSEIISQSFKRLTVVTYSLDVLENLRCNEGIDIIMCGGNFMRDENAFIGELTAEFFVKLHVVKSFVFPAAFSLSSGIMCTEERFIRIQRALINIADQVVIMGDSSKVEKKALYSMCPVNPSFTYITDSSTPDTIVKLYEENGIHLLRSKP